MPKFRMPIAAVALAAVAALAVAVLAHFSAGAPARSESGWSRLPPGTEWAVRARGVAGLLRRSMDDPAMRFLLRRGAEELDRSAAASITVETAGTETFAARLEQVMSLYGVLSGPLAVIAPQTIIVGRGGRGIFALSPQPTGAAAVVATHPEVTYLDSIGAHFTLHDGMLVVAENTAQIDDIIENWSSEARPLGPAPAEPAGPAGESITIAVAGSGSGGRLPGRPPAAIAPLAPPPPPPQQQSQQPLPPGGMLAFRNPFAANAGDRASASAPAGPAFVMTIVPAPGGWEIFGRAGEGPGGAGEAEELTAEIPEAKLPAGSDVAAAAAFSDSAREALLGRLLRLTDLQLTAPPRFAPLLGWLREALLARVGGGVTLFVGSPGATGPTKSYAPIPALALGWTWSGPPASEGFTREFVAGLAALRAPGGGAIADFLRAAVRSREEATRLGRAIVVTLPASLVSGAEVTCLAGTDGMGWLATGPEALPGEPGAGGSLLRTVPSLEDGEIRVHAVWGMTPAFRDGAAAFLAERWRAVPTGRRREFSALASAARWAEWFAAAYPQGRLAARVGAVDGAALWRATVRGREEEGR